MDALEIQEVSIDEHCVGSRWVVVDAERMAKLVAIVAMGQASRAAAIITSLRPATPAFTRAYLCDEAIIRLTVEEPPGNPKKGCPLAHRDGFIFEVISWVAAKQAAIGHVLLKDPHVSATSQGIDGLQLNLDAEMNEIVQTTIFEDKCTDNPRSTFLQSVLKTFKDRHENKRCAELVSCAADLLQRAGMDEERAAYASAKVTDLKFRSYRSAFSVPTDFDSKERRQHLFSRFDELSDLKPAQRIGACLITSDHMRDWFSSVANSAVAILHEWKKEDTGV